MTAPTPSANGVDAPYPPGQPPSLRNPSRHVSSPFAPGAPGPPGIDPYARTQSLASHPRTQLFHPAPATAPAAPSIYVQPAIPHLHHSVNPPHIHQPFHPSPAQALRQKQYVKPVPGRPPPEPSDYRSMSMSSYARDQVVNGRPPPRQNRESYETTTSDDAISLSSAAPSSPSTITHARQRSDSGTSIATIPSRTFSMASTVVDGINSPQSQHAPPKPSSSSHQRRSPLVYPALLSRVAEVFREHIVLNDYHKDGLDYTSAFTGEEAVTLITFIIKTTDRNLALLLGRSLDAQKFYHDVTYAHRLRDLRTELYQFRESQNEIDKEVNGVFTLLTECYSPTCTDDRLCYSISCPRRFEQQAKQQNSQPRPDLQREPHPSIQEDIATPNNEQILWINTVSKEVSDSIPDKEKKRQEIISELAFTERDFVKDLEYLRDVWIKPLRNPQTSPIPDPDRREKVILSVFSNLSEIYHVNSKLSEALTHRQQETPIVHNVADIFLGFVDQFDPFITYGGSQVRAKYDLETERNENQDFAQFVELCERKKESRKLELNGYLIKPTQRVARYPLLLEGILKATADDNPDKKQLPIVIAAIKACLTKVNAASGKAENRLALYSLERKLAWPPGEKVDLKLSDENRQLVFKVLLKRNAQDSQGDIQAYVFDHALLLVREKSSNKKDSSKGWQKDKNKVWQKPIPLELLTITELPDVLPHRLGIVKRPNTALAHHDSVLTIRDSKPTSLSITFNFLGRHGYRVQLFCEKPIQQQKLMENILTQQDLLNNRANVYNKNFVSKDFFSSINRINCCVPINDGRTLVLGTDSGVYTLDRDTDDVPTIYMPESDPPVATPVRKPNQHKPRKVLDCKSVTGIDILEQYQMLLVLTEKNLNTYSTDALTSDDSTAPQVKKGRRICHANFFKTGVCDGRLLVCTAKTSAMSTSVKAFEPMGIVNKKSKKSGLYKMLGHSKDDHDGPTPLNECYIPADSMSIHFLRSRVCVCCTKGLEVIDVKQRPIEVQPLLDAADTSLEFIKTMDTAKPVHIERVSTDTYLVCYTEFSLYVNRNGWRAKADWLIMWQGVPTAFAVFGNRYILAFEPSFVEIRHLNTRQLLRVITGKNIRLLHSGSREILYAYEDENGMDIIASLDFLSDPTIKGMPGVEERKVAAKQNVGTTSLTLSPVVLEQQPPPRSQSAIPVKEIQAAHRHPRNSAFANSPTWQPHHQPLPNRQPQPQYVVPAARINQRAPYPPQQATGPYQQQRYAGGAHDQQQFSQPPPQISPAPNLGHPSIAAHAQTLAPNPHLNQNPYQPQHPQQQYTNQQQPQPNPNFRGGPSPRPYPQHNQPQYSANNNYNQPPQQQLQQPRRDFSAPANYGPRPQNHAANSNSMQGPPTGPPSSVSMQNSGPPGPAAGDPFLPPSLPHNHPQRQAQPSPAPPGFNSSQQRPTPMQDEGHRYTR